MELNSDHIYQYWEDQSQKDYSVGYCTGVLKLQVYHSCQVTFHLGICIPQSLENLSTVLVRRNLSKSRSSS